MSVSYNHTKDAALGLLMQEIQDSSIVAILEGSIPYSNGTIDLVFDNTLSAGDITTMDAIVAAHAIPIRTLGEHENYIFEGTQVSSGTFTRIAAYMSRGSVEHAVPYKVEVLGYVDSGSSGQIRLYDKTNGVELGISEVFSNSAEGIISIPITGAWSTSSATIELQGKRVSGNANKKIYLNTMMIGY